MEASLPALLLVGAAAGPLIVLGWRLVRSRDKRSPSPPPRRYLRYRGRARLRQARQSEVSRKDVGAGPVTGAIGLSLVLASLGVGLLVLEVEDLDVPEERGIGISPSVPPDPGRGFAVSAGLTIRSCDDPVGVTIVVTGSAEYWIDHARELRNGGEMRVAIPDLEVSNPEVFLGADGKLSPIAPFEAGPTDDRRLVSMPVDKGPSTTILGARIDGWGRHLRPVVFRFDADWLSQRSRLGTCYLRIPALAGAATVLSAQEQRGKAVTDVSQLDCPCSVLTVSSAETGLEAYYDPAYETTRGVVAVDIGRNTIDSGLSHPPPDGAVRGLRSWTCATRPATGFQILERVRRGVDRPDLVEGSDPDATGAVSVRRLGTAITERSCASLAVIEEASAQLKRDLVLLVLGVVFSLGVAMVVEFARSRIERNRGPR